MTKNKTIFKSLAFISLGLALTVSAGATEDSDAIRLKNVQGKVMVNTGSEYVAGKSGMILKPGYKVMVSEKGTAQILYANDCEEVHTGESLITVKYDYECTPTKMIDGKSAVKEASLGNVFVAPVLGGVNPAIVAWGAGLGVAASASNGKSNSNQVPNASAF